MRKVMVMDEVLHLLKLAGASDQLIKKVTAHAEHLMDYRSKSAREDEATGLIVQSGLSTTTGRGFVELTVNDQRIQMEAQKAREIGIMFFEAAEAAISDEVWSTLLKDKIGVDDPEQRAVMLANLREIRQGTRGVSWFGGH